MAYRFIDEPQSPASKEESTPGMIGRNLIGSLSSFASGAASVPRNIAELLSTVHGLTSQAGRALLPESITKQLPQQQRSPYLELLPTQEQAKETIGKVLPKGYLEPQSEAEQFVQDFSSDVGSLLFPLPGAPTLSKAAKIAGVGNIAGFLSRNIGVDPDTAQGIKTGTMLLTSLGMQPSLKQKATEMYKRVDEITPPTATVSAKPVHNIIRSVERSAENLYGQERQAVNEIAKRLDSVTGLERAGLGNLIKFKQGLSDARTTFKNLPKTQAIIGKVSREVNSIIKNNPEVPKEIAELLTKADQIYAGINSSNKIFNFIKKHKNISKYLVGSGLMGIVAHDPEKALEKIGKGAATVGALYAGSRGFGTLKNIITNPSIRNEYAKMMSSALKENVASTAKYAKKLNESLEEQEVQPSGRYRFID